jgi:hypothetical protein
MYALFAAHHARHNKSLRRICVGSTLRKQRKENEMAYRYEVVTKDREIYLMADFIGISERGDLVFSSNIKGETENQPVAIFAAGVWLEIYAVSMLDGSRTAVDSVFAAKGK